MIESNNEVYEYLREIYIQSLSENNKEEMSIDE